MNIIVSFNIFVLKNEEMPKQNWANTSWTIDVAGREVTVTIQEVIDFMDRAGIDMEEIPVEQISELCIHKGKKDPETLQRSSESDLEYPIIIAKDHLGWTMILDGHHRLLKAINLGQKYIRARVLDLNTAPRLWKKFFGK